MHEKANIKIIISPLKQREKYGKNKKAIYLYKRSFEKRIDTSLEK